MCGSNCVHILVLFTARPQSGLDLLHTFEIRPFGAFPLLRSWISHVWSRPCMNAKTDSLVQARRISLCIHTAVNSNKKRLRLFMGNAILYKSIATISVRIPCLL